MKREIVYVKKKILVGIQTHTSYEDELNTITSKILPLIQQWFQDDVAENIPNSIKPWCGYVQYSEFSDQNRGNFTFFMGKEASEIPTLPTPFVSQVTEEGVYAKFTTKKGPVPFVSMEAWKRINDMSEKELGGKRLFKTDFEFYEDSRCYDPNNIEGDIYVGIKTGNNIDI